MHNMKMAEIYKADFKEGKPLRWFCITLCRMKLSFIIYKKKTELQMLIVKIGRLSPLRKMPQYNLAYTNLPYLELCLFKLFRYQQSVIKPRNMCLCLWVRIKDWIWVLVNKNREKGHRGKTVASGQCDQIKTLDRVIR